LAAKLGKFLQLSLFFIVILQKQTKRSWGVSLKTLNNQLLTMNSELPSSLLRWFKTHARELPWRGTRDPYAIWLSEVILQQTRIQQGWAYWERFMNRWPTVEKLADASEDEVLREWQGLGYYSRARNLHQAARQIVEMGGFPTTYEGIRSLKGVGDYTAAAIGSIAFSLPVAAVDGNVYRVLARYFGIDTPINSSEGKKEFAALAQSLLPHDVPSAFNQAMMDFGAMQCTPRSPHCTECPLAESCVAWREHRVEELPVKLRKMKVRERYLTYYYIRCNGDVAIHQRGGGDIWQGLWEPLLVESQSEGMAGDCGIDFSTGVLTLLQQRVKHVLTHRILWADFYLWETVSRPMLPPDYIWIRESDIDEYAIPRLVELLIEHLEKYP
jgi:A/G-specific adenine glycosylase